ncbi:MAG: biotin/lipoyl-binding protein [Ectothiorhodospiraceae bacterium]|nr:biotin/lipoyl-binding protein [Ectothiorhodospiraceae bacterium]
MRLFRRILIANRGEIAVRIARTCRRLGVEYVAIYSEVDAGAPHLDGAVRTVCVGPGAAAESYLDVERVVRAGVETGCEAVHPGYGFLSENPRFARAVAEAGMTFIGPSPETIQAMGDKATAKALMAEAGVPVVPGTSEADEDPERIASAAERVGFPVLLKPVAGGGGKGMSVVERMADLPDAVAAAVRVARTSFGDGRLLVERFVQRPRHIEIQVFGDAHGNVVHLFERECSLQRRHQKIVEEAPAVDLPEDVRAAMREAAVAGARAIGYRNAGTFEFILSEEGEFYFLEVNTRLQVEHPVTEMVVGVDLVEWQLRVACGEPLPLAQEALRVQGHAVECRVYAEDAEQGFRPAPGRVLALRWPEGIRVDAGIRAGGEVTAFYDPMVAKLIAHDVDRTAALARMHDALGETALLGLTTNLGFLSDLLAHPAVLQGQIHTGFVDAHLDALVHGQPREAMAVACAAAVNLVEAAGHMDDRSPWCGVVGSHDRRHLEQTAPYGRCAVRIHEDWRDARVVEWHAGCATVDVDGDRFRVEPGEAERGDLLGGCLDNGRRWFARRHGDALEMQIHGGRFRLLTGAAAEAVEVGDGGALSPLPGLVAAVRVTEGDQVAKGDPLVIIEAMKMENTVVAPVDGVVAEVRVRTGDQVDSNQLLVQVASSDT